MSPASSGDGAASSVADIRKNFYNQLVQMQQLTTNAYQASQLQAQRKWMQPVLGDWSGDVFDLEGLAIPFDRSDNSDDYLKALDPSAPGVLGDLQVAQLQAEWLAVQERAYRARLVSRCRAEQHTASRFYGHGHEAGLYKKSILGSLQGIAANSKNSGSSA